MDTQRWIDQHAMEIAKLYTAITSEVINYGYYYLEEHPEHHEAIALTLNAMEILEPLIAMGEMAPDRAASINTGPYLDEAAAALADVSRKLEVIRELISGNRSVPREVSPPFNAPASRVNPNVFESTWESMALSGKTQTLQPKSPNLSPIPRARKASKETFDVIPRRLNQLGPREKSRIPIIKVTPANETRQEHNEAVNARMLAMKNRREPTKAKGAIPKRSNLSPIPVAFDARETPDYKKFVANLKKMKEPPASLTGPPLSNPDAVDVTHLNISL